MGLEVVDADKRFLIIESQAFGEGKTDKKRPDKTGPLSHGVSVDPVKGEAGPPQALADNVADRAKMLARSQLRNNAAVRGMDFILREDDAGEDFPLTRQD